MAATIAPELPIPNPWGIEESKCRPLSRSDLTDSGLNYMEAHFYFEVLVSDCRNQLITD